MVICKRLSSKCRVLAISSALVLLLFLLALSVLTAKPVTGGPQDGWSADKALQSLAALEPIDTHVHIMFKGDPTFNAMLARVHMHVLDILLVDDHHDYRKNWPQQHEDAFTLFRGDRGHVSLGTTFDPFKFNDADFAQSAIAGLDRDFADGAIAVKIWKNIGMELKDEGGRYVEADDPRLQPIYQDIQKHDRTLIAHLAEPDEAWLPPNLNGLDYPYYKENPTWYMHDKPAAPKKQQILDARDHVLAMNPKLRVVGAHLGSMEDDLAGLGKRFDRYPNFATDTAARVVHLVVRPSDEVRAFIVKYQDRLVYGTDLEVAVDQKIDDAIKEWQDQYARDWRYFATRDSFEYDGHKTQGLGLPPEVLRKLYHSNAVRWFPGVASK
jgi:predicted TIM-barrel fold metal-dependent hydrolase